MSRLLILICLCFSSFGYSQTLPIDFESGVVTADFVDFDGGTAAVIPNPQPTGSNTSGMVGQIVRNGGAIWSGSKIQLDDALDFMVNTTMRMKVYTTAPVGTVVKFKLEGNGSAERDALTTVSNAWETLTWDFTGTPPDFNNLVFMFDFGNVGNGSEQSTFLFDDVELLYAGKQIDFPVDFESSDVNYTLSDFGGNLSEVVMDPTNNKNTVAKVIKTTGAATWAGTTIGTPAGFATFLPITLDDSKMTVKVWAPKAGTAIRLKVEDHADPTHTCETQSYTTVGGEWETIVFDFNNQAMGTELLSIGLAMGWKYNMASIFFDFDTEGDDATYYFDNVRFGDFVLGLDSWDNLTLGIHPNPTMKQWRIESSEDLLMRVELYDVSCNLLSVSYPGSPSFAIDATGLNPGSYIARIATESGQSVSMLLFRAE